MPIRSTGRPRPGMAAVAAVGAIALVITAGAVLSGTPEPAADTSAAGVLRSYTAEPSEAWILDDAVLPGVTGPVTVAATDGDDWLISYPAGIRHQYLLVDARSGEPRWNAPVNAGFGACAVNDRHQIGCAVRLRIDGPENGFYLVDRDSGDLTRTADGDDTAALLGLGSDFVHVNQTGYQVSLRSPSGEVRWSRTFAGAAKLRRAGGSLLVDTSDDAHFVIAPADGTDRVACSSCTVDVYSTGLAVTRTALGAESVAMYPIAGDDVAQQPAGTAARMRVIRGPSTLPVLTAAGEGSSLEAAGHYEIVDPATGSGLWQIGDPQLSKANARPCGAVFSVARKDRSRVFFDLADGTRRGAMPPPSLDDPDSAIDSSSCVGASGDVAVFANPNQLTAYSIDSGAQLWNRSLLGTATDVDGYLVLQQGTTLTALRPN
ncbi:PQQ-binding-like beta-propeller repeat protein [Gordonia neofelifaecis]|uniref:Pyrrolo-quinoline quinone n=1 Tax=Gordonia neofelifaecis NRRL B-59395 TaxID=644548 RepID=F1YLE2_9ACTN|nr:PQQ-binding-like beta-propeller repeat protein [Gordonia neofelifaecis]EGD54336.1 hypothetical protein SCNU_13669 [Gordonia neofelifaecis NRRL B-59395]